MRSQSGQGIVFTWLLEVSKSACSVWEAVAYGSLSLLRLPSPRPERLDLERGSISREAFILS